MFALLYRSQQKRLYNGYWKMSTLILKFFQKNLKQILEAIFNLSFVRYRVLFFNNLNLQIVKVNLIDKIVLIETRFGVALELIDR